MGASSCRDRAQRTVASVLNVHICSSLQYLLLRSFLCIKFSVLCTGNNRASSRALQMLRSLQCLTAIASRRMDLIGRGGAPSASALGTDALVLLCGPEAQAGISTCSAAAESAASPQSSCSWVGTAQHSSATRAEAAGPSAPCGPAPLLRNLRTPSQSGRLSGAPPTWISAAAASLGNSPRFAASARCSTADVDVSRSGLEDASALGDCVDRWSTPAATVSGIALLHQYHNHHHNHHHIGHSSSSCGSVASSTSSVPGSAAGSPFPPRPSLPSSATNSSRFLMQSQSQQLRSVSFTAATAAPKAAAKGASAKAGSSSSSGAAAPSPAAAALRTPEWARVPGHLHELQDLYRKRQKRMAALRHGAQVELEAREAVAWKTGGRGRAVAAAAKAALDALPLPPPEGKAGDGDGGGCPRLV